jgi:isoquinoline 1-oxidoreductase subunit beta
MSKVGPVLSRRAFMLLATAVAGAGLVFGLRLAPGTDPDAVEIYNWITVAPDNTITIRVAQMEMGQGVMTSMAQLLAEELEADWSKVKTEYISIRTQLERHGVYGRTNTTSSMAVRGSQTMLRTCGAQIRTMFVRAASERLGVPQSELLAKNSSVTHVPTGRRLSHGELA